MLITLIENIEIESVTSYIHVSKIMDSLMYHFSDVWNPHEMGAAFSSNCYMTRFERVPSLAPDTINGGLRYADSCFSILFSISSLIKQVLQVIF
jgi:hypothetical protein